MEGAQGFCCTMVQLRARQRLCHVVLPIHAFGTRGLPTLLLESPKSMSRPNNSCPETGRDPDASLLIPFVTCVWPHMRSCRRKKRKQ